MALVDATYALELGFTPGSQAFPDPDRPPLLRARPRAATPYGDDGLDVHLCDATDWAQDDSVRPDLTTFGFDLVDLTEHDGLQGACVEIHTEGRISDPAAAAIRTALDGAVLQCSSGHNLTVLYVADEGLIMRTGGPNGMSLVGPRSKGMNGHSPAMAVHGDQDVHGTPLAQLMDGRAPSLFRHDSPDGYNHDASLMLVNLWIPIQQITQPLVLGDGRTIDRPRHQLRYGLPTDSFLDRDDDQNVNDIWAFLHDPDQRWYFRSEMDHRRAYVFNTLSTPHTSAVLPGEDVAERCYLALEAAESAIERGDAAALGRVASEAADIDVPDRAPPALRHAIADMVALLEDAGAAPASVCGHEAHAWSARSRAARRRVVRMSVELRMVVSIDA
jgi:hypothetical protein